MILDDMPRFEYAMTRLARVELRQAPDRDMLRDWWEQLKRYPIEAVVAAMHQAPGEREKRGERMMTAGLVEGLCRKHAAAHAPIRQTHYTPKGRAVIDAPGTRWHGKAVTIVDADFSCPYCQDTGVVRSYQPQRPDIDAKTLARYEFVRDCDCRQRRSA